jgi:carbon-monoxide dehydrogenase medium subunit
MKLEQPTDLGGVLEALALPGSMLVAGATSVTLLLKHRLVEPERLVSLRGVAELATIEVREDGGLWIGATTTLRTIARAPEVRATFPTIASAAGEIGNPRVRSVATLGGHLAHADPRQDLPPVLLALDGRVLVAGLRGRREIPLSSLAVGLMETRLEEEEVILGVYLPPRRAGSSGASLRYTPVSVEDFPTVSVAVEVCRDGDGIVRAAQIAVGGAGPTALLMEEAAALLQGGPLDAVARDAAGAEVARRVAPVEDRQGSPAYKAAMASLWTRRALEVVASSGDRDEAGR